MKKILHLFSDPSHSALWSRYLRMLTLIVLFAFGSHGVWGAELTGKLGEPANKGKWDSSSNKYTWDAGSNNLMDLFSGTDLTGKLGEDYAAIVFTTSGYTSGQEYRIVFMDKDEITKATIVFYSEGTNKTVVFAEHNDTKKVDLSTVKYIKFGGNSSSSSGSITLDPSSIKLVGHKVTFSSNDVSKGTVSATYYNQEFKSGNAVAPGTKLTLTATPNGNNLFYTWRQKVGDKYIAPWDGDYDAGFNSATSTATVTKDLDMQADFSSILVKAVQKESDKEYGSVTIVKDGNDKGATWHVTPWPGPTSFVATDGTKGFFVGWFTNPEYSTPAKTVTIEGKEYKSTDKTYITNEIQGSDFTLYAKFERGFQVNAKVEPAFLNPTIKIHQLNEPTWVISNGQYVKINTTAVYNVDDISGYTFLGWYEGDTQKSTEKSYYYGGVKSDLTLTAKFECNIANNTQKVELSGITAPGNNNVTAVSWDTTNKELSVTTKNNSNNVLYLKSFSTDDKRGTGIRIHAKGAKYRVIVRLNNKDTDTKVKEIDETTDGYVTRHYSWKDFGLTDDDIKNITDVGVAGLNTTKDSTKYTFYVQHFWIDDIADYNHTIACYGEENGKYDNGVYTYSHTNDGVKAAFSGIGGSDRITETQSMKFKTGDTNKLNISSSNYNFSSIGLIFDSSVSYNLSIGGKKVSGTGVAVVVPVNGSSIDIINNGTNALSLAKITYTGKATGIHEERSITVDGKTRKYWIYAPGSVDGEKNVPVVISLHGRYGSAKDHNPNFNTLAQKNNFIVVYPQGRDGASTQDKTDYPGDWHYAFGGGTGWEATGEENADTKFIQALVDELKKNKFNNTTTVDPKRFYLCGFSMGGMMTYACAKVLNGTFAAYGSCGGFPINEFHLNLATKQPIPFMHLHGNRDNMLGINHLHTIIENLLFRNGCSLKDKNTTTQWTNTKENGETHEFKRYDFTGLNGVPVTTVTFNGLWHDVEASAPKYLWDFFSPKTLDTYKPTTMKWQWDMTTINSNLSASNGYPYGWKRVTNVPKGANRYLSYGDNRITTCTADTIVNGTSIKCSSALASCNGNHNVYNSIQLEKGTYKLHAKANVVSSDATGIIVGIYKVVAKDSPDTCIIRRQVKNNSGTASANLSILYPFTITDYGEYYVKVERGNESTTCTDLAIHTSDYAPDDEDDSENAMTLVTGWETKDRIVKIDFEKVGEKCVNIGEEMTATNHTDNFSFVQFKDALPTSDYKLYCLHKGDNIQTWDKSAVIQKDSIFGNYFQNIPKAQFYDRSARDNYMRAVLPDKALSPIRKSGAATIGFWVNGRVAVDAGLSCFDASMLYLSGPYHSAHYAPTEDNGKEASDKQYQCMFNIRCNGNTNGFLKDIKNRDTTQVRYYADKMFGDLCDNNTHESYYKKNLYLDRNWHYITMVMFNGLRNVDMYVDGELTHSRQNIVGSGQDLTAGLDTINHIIIGGLNATYTEFTYDPAFAFDDIVIYSRALSAQEIQEIIKKKNYSPNSWDFEKNIANTALLNKDKLKESYWKKEGNDVYTLSKKLNTPAELTYDGNRVIPAFRGLKFKATATEQIKIDMKKNRLIVVGKGDSKPAVEMTISNAPAGQYIRYEYDKGGSGWLQDWSETTHTFKGDIWTSNSQIGITKVEGKIERQTCTCNVHGTIYFKSIGSTDKEYADLCFGSIKDSIVNNVNREVFTSTPKVTVDTEDLSFTEPKLHLFFNGLGANKDFNTTNSNGKSLKDLNVKFWSSAPHVAYITSTDGNQPKVKATGVPGSAYIYAELENNNQYDCNTEDKDLYSSSNRIIARYEIHVPNKVKGYSVKISADKIHIDDKNKFIVGDTLKTTDKAVTLTLGGWLYDSDTYPGDGYTEKVFWKGMPLNKTTNDTNGYKSEYDTLRTYTDDNTYSGLNFYTGGTYAAKSEQLYVDSIKGMFYTKSVENNRTAWTLPCRGSYAKVEPTEAGIISVYVLQEGCMERNMTKNSNKYFDSYPEVAPNEPYDINIKRVYVADEAGNIIDKVITDTKSKIVSQVWKDDGRARAEYSYYVSSTAYSLLLHNRFLKNIVEAKEDAVPLLDKWNSPGMTQNIIKFGKGYGIVDKGVVRYTFNVLPGKTYYIFSNDAKMGIAGFNFTKNKQLDFKYDKNKGYIINESSPLADSLKQTSVSFNDVLSTESGKVSLNISENKNVKLTYNRSFTKDTWSSICLPYSISSRQMKEQFGEGTQVVLLNKIYDKNGHGIVQFIWHANQDIIAGYPYLILPTKTTDKIATNSAILKTEPLFSVTEGQQTIAYDNSDSESGYVFKGNFEEETIPVGSYVLNTSGKLARVGAAGLKLKPFRAYLRNNAGQQAKVLTTMAFSGWDDLDDLGNTTSIDEILEENGIFTKGANVYDLNGVLVRKNTHTIQGLPKGIYIVNGKKYVVK